MALFLTKIKFSKLHYINNKSKTITYAVSRNLINNSSILNSNSSFVLFENRIVRQKFVEISKGILGTNGCTRIRNDSFFSNSTNYNIISLSSSTKSILCHYNSFRNYSTDNRKSQDDSGGQNIDEKTTSNRKRSLPQLMDFPEIVWPSIMKTIKNWILVTFIIRPYFDREFNLPDFVYGTKQALQVVSAKLAEGDLSSLSDLVTTETIAELKKVIAEMSVAQRMELRVNKEDIYLSFPYQVGIMFDESNEKIQKRWVEITMVFHVLRGLKEMQDRGQPPPLNMGVLPEYRDKVSICNYRFIKEFTQGNESDWTINVINHFKPSDFLSD